MNVDPHGEPTRSEIRQSRIIFCVFALSFLSNFASSCADIPILQLYEDAICRTFYANKSERAPNVEDRQPCKIPVIQDRLAYYIGYKSTFDAIARSSQVLTLMVNLMLISVVSRPNINLVRFFS